MEPMHIFRHKALSFWALFQRSWEHVDEDSIKQKREEWLSQIPTTDIVDGEEVEEKVIVFFEEAEEVRAEPELGGLGPGFTGEYTLYNFGRTWVYELAFRCV
eukprot:750817-Hanusia_phi.AAC.4